jgi:hypothetical protein
MFSQLSGQRGLSRTLRTADHYQERQSHENSDSFNLLRARSSGVVGLHGSGHYLLGVVSRST